jgi:hypothetical protein
MPDNFARDEEADAMSEALERFAKTVRSPPQ